MPEVDVVVVSYNSRERLRACVEPLLELEDVRVIVVDNASPDGSLEAVRDLDVTAIQLPEQRRLRARRQRRLAGGLGALRPALEPGRANRRRIARGARRRGRGGLDVGAVAPRIVHTDGSLDYSQRRFPRLRSTYAQALFLHRIFPSASWTDELVRDDAAYGRRADPDWVSGACVLVRRRALEELSGLDEGFFMYCEDIDLCKRLRAAGYEILFAPEAVVVHEGGASTPRAQLLPVLAASRLRYASKHRGRTYALLERAGIALGAVTHAALGRGGGPARAGHLRALRTAVRQPTQS